MDGLAKLGEYIYVDHRRCNNLVWNITITFAHQKQVSKTMSAVLFSWHYVAEAHRHRPLQNHVMLACFTQIYFKFFKQFKYRLAHQKHDLNLIKAIIPVKLNLYWVKLRAGSHKWPIVLVTVALLWVYSVAKYDQLLLFYYYYLKHRDQDFTRNVNSH